MFTQPFFFVLFCFFFFWFFNSLNFLLLVLRLRTFSKKVKGKKEEKGDRRGTEP